MMFHTFLVSKIKIFSEHNMSLFLGVAILGKLTAKACPGVSYINKPISFFKSNLALECEVE